MKEENSLFDIDQYNLDKEWLRQPKETLFACQAVAEANADLSRAKAKEKVVTAELSKAIRADPQNFGVEKTTEEIVKHTIVLQPEHKEATRKVIEAELSYDMAKAKSLALIDRKHALENEVSLWSQSYFGNPRTPANDLSRDTVEEMKRNRRKAGRN